MCSIAALGVSIDTFEPVKFPDPACVHRGVNLYLTREGETVRLGPQIRVVERTVDSRGVPTYRPTEWDWVPVQDQELMKKALAWPGRNFIATSREEVLEAARREKAILERLFGYKWFYEKGNEKHPAYKEWRMCVQLIQRGGFKPDPEEFDRMIPAARATLDAYLLIRLSEGDIKRFTLGRLASIGDEAVQKKITSRIEDPEEFEDILVELYTAAWHKKEGRTMALREVEGFPDVRVKIDSVPQPILIECKRVTVATSNRIGQVIKKASSQIEVGSQGPDADAYGAVVLDFTGSEGAQPYSGRSIPTRIEDAMLQVKRALSGEKNHHVKSAIVVWDEYQKIGTMPDPVQLLLGRRAELVNHSLNKSPLRLADLFDGYNVGLVFQPVADERR